ncbi:hypothetical protein PTSG_08552 [Salpingoeca rosetta]|uniref:GAR domain-containing protein n=1 Tax=Salpingoeca rosetta (strain ATCC 50818 / BSB-021) TaxID=946362 RepID=F2UK08_SALR5|nr:uncharacterized protein PTSG_08552 [Salpingoeca rosetta]EGD77457.1 hypothetical protein PTSG_08552 [Salpingoeca rosetta]|eukprot:XP_004990345.1 hypothetical protein PTSG_08552 [Salpingoeca rosetta]
MPRRKRAGEAGAAVGVGSGRQDNGEHDDDGENAARVVGEAKTCHRNDVASSASNSSRTETTATTSTSWTWDAQTERVDRLAATADAIIQELLNADTVGSVSVKGVQDEYEHTISSQRKQLDTLYHWLAEHAPDGSWKEGLDAESLSNIAVVEGLHGRIAELRRKLRAANAANKEQQDDIAHLKQQLEAAEQAAAAAKKEAEVLRAESLKQEEAAAAAAAATNGDTKRLAAELAAVRDELHHSKEMRTKEREAFEQRRSELEEEMRESKETHQVAVAAHKERVATLQAMVDEHQAAAAATQRTHDSDVASLISTIAQLNQRLNAAAEEAEKDAAASAEKQRKTQGALEETQKALEDARKGADAARRELEEAKQAHAGEVKRLEGAVAEAAREEEALRAQQKKLQELREEDKRAMDEALAESKATHGKVQGELKDRIAELERRLDATSDDSKHRESELASKAQDLEQQLAALRAVSETDKANLTRLESEAASSADEIARLQARVDELTRALRACEESKQDEGNARAAAAQAENRRLSQQVAELEAKALALEAQVEQQRREWAAAVEEEAAAAAQLRTDLQEAMARAARAEEEVAAAHQELEDMRPAAEQVAALTAELEQTRALLAEAREEIARLQKELDALRERLQRRASSTSSSSSRVARSPRPETPSRRLSSAFVKASKDAVHRAVSDVLQKHGLGDEHVSFLGRGKYRFLYGNDFKVVNVAQRGNNFMVRVGGGWVSLDEFIREYVEKHRYHYQDASLEDTPAFKFSKKHHDDVQHTRSHIKQLRANTASSPRASQTTGDADDDAHRSLPPPAPNFDDAVADTDTSTPGPVTDTDGTHGRRGGTMSRELQHNNNRGGDADVSDEEDMLLFNYDN